MKKFNVSVYYNKHQHAKKKVGLFRLIWIVVVVHVTDGNMRVERI